MHHLPNQAARALIHSVIQLYAAGKWTRQQMMDRIHQTMKQYGCTTLHFENFTVRITEPVVTSMGQFNVAIIESHSISSRLGCPVCYSAEAGYLAGDKVITAACRDCGCIYKFREKEVNKG